MEQIPILGTQETAQLRGDYPSIEYLEAGNIGSWLQERQDQLLIRARDERNGMNLAKFITLATSAVGAGEQRDFVRSGKKVRSLKLSFLYEVILFAINISNCTINHLDEISQKDC